MLQTHPTSTGVQMSQISESPPGGPDVSVVQRYSLSGCENDNTIIQMFTVSLLYGLCRVENHCLIISLSSEVLVY